MSSETIEIPIVGLCPLLMHNGAMADPLEERVINLAAVTSKRNKTMADHKEIARREWYGSLWLASRSIRSLVLPSTSASLEWMPSGYFFL
jgi:hypothetical protein